jgi:hypothetical protein
MQTVEGTPDMSGPSVSIVQTRELTVSQTQLPTLHRVPSKRIFHLQQWTRNLVRIYLLVLFYSQIITYAFSAHFTAFKLPALQAAPPLLPIPLTMFTLTKNGFANELAYFSSNSYLLIYYSLFY